MSLQRLAPLGLAVALLAGCSKKGGKEADFVPPPDKARAAVEAVLANWQNGNPSGPVPGKSAPAIVMQDWGWQKDRKLAGFEILKEDTPGQGPRYFAVRLTLADGKTVETRYVVYGIDPLYVVREEDYTTKLTGAGM